MDRVQHEGKPSTVEETDQSNVNGILPRVSALNERLAEIRATAEAIQKTTHVVDESPNKESVGHDDTLSGRIGLLEDQIDEIESILRDTGRHLGAL